MGQAEQQKPAGRVRYPVSSRRGIDWPALPGGGSAMVMALQYQFDQSQWWPAHEIEALQLGQAELLLSHAAKTVPFYKGRLDVLKGIKRGDLSMDLWRRIPFLTRPEIQQHGPRMESRRVPKDHGPVNEVVTSGSTGRPIRVKVTMVTAMFFQAMNLRYHRWFDRDFSGKMARITRDRPEYEQIRTWASGHRSGPIVAFDISQPASGQLAWLEEQQPDYLLTYATNAKALLQAAEETGVRIPSLREIMTFGETLDPAARELCERVWGIPLTDAYSSQETGIISAQCPDHTHQHIQSESVLVEILDASGAPCAPGAVGRVVVTDLHNFAMPLIRYEIGDYAEAGGPCPCGRGLPVINRIMGRVRNMLLRPSGERFWPVFSGALGRAGLPIRQAQVIQERVEELEVRLVTARPLSADEEDTLRALFSGALGDDFAYRFVYVEEIERSAGDEFEEARSALT